MIMRFLFALAYVFILSANAQQVSELLLRDICPNLSSTLTCSSSAGTEFTPVVTEALYGIKSVASDLCEYKNGDCYTVSTTSYCQSPFATCSIFPSTSYRVPNCQNQIAEYLHIRYRCVPWTSPTITNYNICSDNSIDITSETGFVSSPSYPTYVIVNNECTRRIVVPSNKVINVWAINDMKSEDTSTNFCITDYVKITDSTGTYTSCGYKKFSFESKLCSSAIYITYKAPTALSSLYRGFRIYYQTVDRSTQPNCGTETPGSPTPGTVPTAPPTTTKPPAFITNLVASGLYKLTACKDKEETISIPASFQLYPFQVYHGVTSDGTCNTIGPQNCRQPTDLVCNAPDSCRILLSTNIPLPDCQNKIANYIGIEYRFIPTTSNNIQSISTTGDINGETLTNGVIRSPNYPTFSANQNLQRKIIAPEGRQIRIFITDLSIEPANGNDCQSGYVNIFGECGSYKLCGDKSTIGSTTYTSCSNIIQIFYYSTSPPDTSSLRGFNLYYEVITPDSALLQPSLGACAGNYINMKCPSNPSTNFTVFYYETLYGVRAVSTNPCEYRPGDCYEPYPFTSCVSETSPTCDILASSSQNLGSCNNNRAEYLFARYFCVPMYSSVINNYNICDRTLTDITDPTGYISSPGYPNYQSVTSECQVRIAAPTNKIIKIWLFIDITSDVTNNCAANYIKITDTTGTYRACGWKKLSYNTQLCSNVVYVSYMAPAILSSTLYKGFRIYYEFSDRSEQPDCLTGTPGFPTTPTTTTTPPQVVFDLAARPTTKIVVCRGNENTIVVPRNFSLFPVDIFYGVTTDGLCNSISATDCKSPAQITCLPNADCKIQLYNDITINDCAGRKADYISFEYRLLPPVSTKNASICDNTVLNLTSGAYGVMTNPGYPVFQPNVYCQRQVVAPVGRFIRVYMNDLGMGEVDSNGQICNGAGFLQVSSTCSGIRYCGQKPPSSSHGVYIFTSCTNTLTLTYNSANPDLINLRGFNMYYEVIVADAASALTLADVCVGSTAALTCDSTDVTKFTPYVSESFYGLKSNSAQGCKYVAGDCYDKESADFCGTSLGATCSIFSSSFNTLPRCSNFNADYFHVRYRCVPTTSTKFKINNICSDQSVDITESSGFIQSPNYPQYSRVQTECTRRIVAPSDKIIKIWINVDQRSAVAGVCYDSDKIKVTDNTGTYIGCGWKKYAYDYQLCSSVIYVSYIANASLTASIYKGLQIYYEFENRNTQPNCPTNTAGSPTTTLPTTTLPPLVADLTGSQLYRTYVCLGNQTTVQVPNNLRLYPISVYYGVSKNSLTCQIGQQDCRAPAQLQCSLQGSCFISLYNNIPVPDCGDTATASYIGFEYRFIPLISSKNTTVCDATTVTLSSTTNYGIITSPIYPDWEPNRDCIRKVVAPEGKFIRIYVNDFKTEEPNENGVCVNGYVRFISSCSNVTYCGEKSSSASYIFETCSSDLEIQYKSSGTSNLYRGFNMYWELAVKDAVSAIQTRDICVSQSANLVCDSTFNTNFTAFISEGLYGVKDTPAGNLSCIYNSADCYGPSTATCSVTTLTTCSQTASSTVISSCGNRVPNYLHLRYKCAPLTSFVIPTYNICDGTLSDLTSTSGFITSPGYPTYQQVLNECMVKISASSNKIVKIWFIESDIKSAEAGNQCPTDYIQLTDNTGIYRICGWKKVSYEKELCSSVVYVNYKAPAVLSSSLYHGFKIYYEFVDRSTQPTCSSVIPTIPTVPPTTTTPKPVVASILATGLLKARVCKGQSTSINIPADYQLVPINVYHGVTPNASCLQVNNVHNCQAPTTLSCSLQGTCVLALLSDVIVPDCSNKVADYIALDYRLVPIVSSYNISICGISISGNLILNANSSGVIASPNYPFFQPNINCLRNMVAPEGKIIRVYVTDLLIDYPNESNECDKSSLTFETGCGKTTYCGEKQNTAGYVFQSCSNTISFQYKSSNSVGFRGFNLYYEVTVADAVSTRLTRDVCGSTTATIACETSTNTNFTVVVSEALLSVKSVASNPCQFNANDCSAASTSTYCTSTSNTCSVVGSSFTLVPRCNDKYADYIHLRYRCVPFTSSVIKEMNVCDNLLGNVTIDRGIISSPNYPTYTVVNTTCGVTIIAPPNKIIAIWLPDVYIKSPESNNDCLTDFVTITHNTGVFKACGNRKYSYENRLCSSEVFINYKAATASSLYRGFKLYYEFIDRSLEPRCPTNLPTTSRETPPPAPTISPITDLFASEIQRDFVCKGNAKTINVPSQFNLFVINFFYGVTTSDSCSQSDTDCKSPLAYPCLTDRNCEISLYNEVSVDDCNGDKASYIGIEYRNIPTISSKNHSICDEDQVSLINYNYGIITSPNYPKWRPNTRCSIRLSVPTDKVIRVYITDLNTEVADEFGRCRSGHLTLFSGLSGKQYCGDKSQSGDYVFISCNSTLDINYESSSILSTTYRGFNLYYEAIDKQGITCPLYNFTGNFTFPQRPTNEIQVITRKPVNHNSSHLKGISLGLGLPLIVGIICVVLYLSRRMRNSGDDESKITFSKLQNADTYSNPNYQ